MRALLFLLLVLAVGAAAFCGWQWLDAESRTQSLGERLTQETRRREGLEMDLFEARSAHQRLLTEVPALIDRRLAGKVESQPAAPPAEAPELFQLRRQINAALRDAGYGSLRVFRVRARDGVELRGVQVHRFGGEGVPVEAYVAEQLVLELDLGRQELVLRLQDGVFLCDGRREPLPPAGVPLALDRSLTVRLMAELAGLVRLTGTLAPDPATTRPVVPVAHMPRAQREELAGRLNELLGRADPGHRLSCLTVGGLVAGALRDVTLLGYSRGLLLDQVLSARALSVECNASGGVELLLRDGTLERGGRKVDLPEDGYRVVLPGVPAAAARAFLAELNQAMR